MLCASHMAPAVHPDLRCRWQLTVGGGLARPIASGVLLTVPDLDGNELVYKGIVAEVQAGNSAITRDSSTAVKPGYRRCRCRCR